MEAKEQAVIPEAVQGFFNIIHALPSKPTSSTVCPVCGKTVTHETLDVDNCAGCECIALGGMLTKGETV